MVRIVVMAIAAAALAVAVAHAASTRPTSSIRLARTACFGDCPIYSVTVRRDGRVVFVGERFVKAKGVRRARISRSSADRLFAAVRKARVFELDSRYDSSNVSDMPSADLVVRLGSRTKRIHHYLGDSSAPSRLKALECLVDRTARTVRWIGRAAALPC
jgi:hypothetical protein